MLESEVNLVTMDDLLSPSECSFLTSYMHTRKYYPYNDTKFIQLIDVPFYHLRVKFLWERYKRAVRKIVPKLKLSYGQLVWWVDGASKGFHIDVDYPPSRETGCGRVDWASIVYLNEKFVGGETKIEDNIFKPKTGKLVLFNSKKLRHAVIEVYGNRYTFMAWWAEVEK